MFKISLATLKDGAELATGDPTFCKNCQAVLNMYSKVEDCKSEMEETQIWKCEFCNHQNQVNIEPEEKPKTKEVNYILEAAA